MKNFFKNFGKKVVGCPNCKRSLRIPVMPGKKLEISCPSCKTKFQVYYPGVKQQFQFTINAIKDYFKRIPIKIILLWFTVFILVTVAIRHFTKSIPQ